jgi:uncharacterized membrane protein
VSDRTLRIAIGVLALAGAAIASYLVFERYTGGAVSCSFGGCETVQRSRYSVVVGIPVAVFGLAAYLVLFALTFSRAELAHAAGLAVALAGVLFGAYLLYAQIVLIGAICEWCVASDAVVTAIAALTLLRLRPRLLEPASG